MRRYVELSIIILAFCPFHTNAVNYCESSLCRAGVQHIACNNNGEFSATCPADRAVIAFTDADKQLILDTHNNLRNRIAVGAEPGFESASAMALLAWNDELAQFALLNVKKCQMAHDPCRNTFHFKYSGQNLGYRADTESFEELSTFLPNVINAWYNEIKDAQQSNIDACCGGANFTNIGHFLQVVQDRSFFVGCAATRYTNTPWKTILLACNYSHGNVRTERVYQTGAPQSACINDLKSQRFSGLCVNP